MNAVLVPLSASNRPRIALPPFGMRATMAFQPIVDLNSKTVFAYEALARGPRNEDAALVLASIDENRLPDFDRACTRTAIRLASLLMVPSRLTINLASAAAPHLFFSFASRTAASYGFSPSQLIFEIGHGRNPQGNLAHGPGEIEELFTVCRRRGFAVALDRFGTADSGLALLSKLRPNAVKLSMQLVRDIHIDPVKRASVLGITQVCSDLGILVIAVGVETAEECRALRDAGISLCQGNCFAPPRLEGLPLIPSTVWPRIERRATPRSSLLWSRPIQHMNRTHPGLR